jgi:hydrogenase expression/formation protein HypD
LQEGAVREAIDLCLSKVPKGKVWKFMEVCGTHTMSIAKMGIRSLLGERIQLTSGPGCPVCVTSESDLRKIMFLSKMDNVIIATFGDMVRVPIGGKNLLDSSADGSHIEIVYSPIDSLKIARDNPESNVVFLAVGFETTSPTIAATIIAAERSGVENFFILPMMKLIPPALRLLCAHPDLQINGFLLPGHVSAIIGVEPYLFIAEEFHKPGVVAGFDDFDIADSLLRLVDMQSKGEARIENSYSRAVLQKGNIEAQRIAARVFRPVDVEWRGIGSLAESGLGLRDEFSRFDAVKRFDIPKLEVNPDPRCRCGDVILGKIPPQSCPQFGRSCTPNNPLGPCMVSSEGACAACYKYGDPNFIKGLT